MPSTRWLDDAEMRAWLGYRRMFLLLNAQISRDLVRDAGLSDPDYDVLSSLSAAPGRQGRLTDLAARMLWSQSRLSHHIRRMEQRGLVRREECESDGRGSVVALTAKGMRTLERAAPGHVESVRRNLIDLLTPAQIKALGDISETVVGHLGDPSAPDPPHRPARRRATSTRK